MMNVTENEIAWLAGILEGEGYFHHINGTPAITCEMTDLDVLEKIQSICGGSIVKQKKRQDHWKQSWRWQSRHKQAAEIMTNILPYMGNRRSEKINKILEAYKQKLIKTRLNNDIKEQAARSWLNGEGSLREIGEKFGVGYETIRRTVNKLKDESKNL